ncbi:MAG: hypothetical protein WB952_03800 [Terriglobales bacterium]
MTPLLYIPGFVVGVWLLVGVAYLFHRLFLGGREFRKFSGKMLVTCPETHQTVAVKVAAARAALAVTAGRERVELSQCTRWPERKDCDQACLSELEANPEKHSVWNIVCKWYEGKSCVYCRRPISELHHLDHPPGLIGLDGKIIEWEKVPAEKLPEELASARAVCWNCSVVEGFRQEHGELVIERPWKH